MTHRRPPPPSSETTALLERPTVVSDAGDTDPARRLAQRHEAPTGRFEMDGLDDLDHFRPSALPSAYVSEFDVSDLDGDVAEGGAATTIMQLPPEMMGHHDLSRADDFEGGEPTNSEQNVEMMRWRAGPPAVPAPADTLPELEHASPIFALQPTPLPPVPGRAAAAATRIDVGGDPHGAATMPALSLEMVRVAAARANLPGPARDAGDARTSTEIRLSAADRLRATVDDALAAVLAAQSCADDGDASHGHTGDAIHDHLARAVQLLSTAQELADDL